MSEDYIASLVLVLLGIIVGFIIGLFTGSTFKK